MTDCAFTAAGMTNHSDDRVLVWHGSPLPLVLCGYHASVIGPKTYEQLRAGKDSVEVPLEDVADWIEQNNDKFLTALDHDV